MPMAPLTETVFEKPGSVITNPEFKTLCQMTFLDTWVPESAEPSRGGSVSLNSLQAIDKWISALVMPLPGLAWAGCHRLDRAFARQAMNVVGAGCRTPDNDQDRDAPPRRFGRPGDRLPRI